MSKAILIPGTLSEMREEVCDWLASKGFEPVFMGEITDADIVCGQAYIDNDICVATIAVVGQAINHIRTQGGGAVLAPEVCKDCRSNSVDTLLADALKRAGLNDIEVVTMSCADISSCLTSRAGRPASGERPAIGLCGNAVMLSTPLFTSVVQKHLEQSGCDVVIPPLNLMVNEQDFLEPCIKWFADQGIKSVIGVLAFGCLGGHVFARGKARRLREMYPEVELTLLDYDPSASDINLVNRTELVIQSAKE